MARQQAAGRLSRLLEPGFPLAGNRRLLDQKALQGIRPDITQAVIEGHDSGTDRFRSIPDSNPTHAVSDILRSWIRRSAKIEGPPRHKSNRRTAG